MDTVICQNEVQDNSVKGASLIPDDSQVPRRTGKRKNFDGYDTGTIGRRTRNSCQNTVLVKANCNGKHIGMETVESSKFENDDWVSKPKFWDILGDGEWTIKIANKINIAPKSCVEKCGKKNSKEMVRCDGCGGWCHFKCVLDNEVVVGEQDYICGRCQTKASSLTFDISVCTSKMDDKIRNLFKSTCVQEQLTELSSVDIDANFDNAHTTHTENNSVPSNPEVELNGSEMCTTYEKENIMDINEILNDLVMNIETNADEISASEITSNGQISEPYSSNVVQGCEVIPYKNCDGSRSGNTDSFVDYMKEISAWYIHGNDSICRTAGELVTLPEYQLDGKSIYFYDTTNICSNETQIVIRNEGKSNIEIMHTINDNYTNINDFSSILDTIKGDKNKDLLSVILKQKGKIDELRSMKNMMMMPSAMMAHVNFLSQKLVDKEKKIQELKVLSKKENMETNELKRAKKESDSKVETTVKDNEKIKKEIMNLRKKNEQLLKEVEALKAKEVTLENKITILQKVSSNITDSNNHTVVIEANDEHVSLVCEECPKMKRKIDTLLKEKSSLNDQVIENSRKHDKVDGFYQDILIQKDLTIKNLTEITQGFDDSDTRFKRLLTYHKAVGEVKHMQTIRDQLLTDGKPQTVESATSTDMQMVSKSTNTTNKGLLSKSANTNSKKMHDVGIQVLDNGKTDNKMKNTMQNAENKINQATNNDPKLLKNVRNSNRDIADPHSSKNGGVVDPHTSKKGGVETDEQKTTRLRKSCWFGKRCFRTRCSFDHGSSAAPPKCRFGLQCNRTNCLFKHTDDCENRTDCVNKKTCQKRHLYEELQDNASGGQKKPDSKASSTSKPATINQQTTASSSPSMKMSFISSPSSTSISDAPTNPSMAWSEPKIYRTINQYIQIIDPIYLLMFNQVILI